jgi:hypothetical protein
MPQRNRHIQLQNVQIGVCKEEDVVQGRRCTDPGENDCGGTQGELGDEFLAYPAGGACDEVDCGCRGVLLDMRSPCLNLACDCREFLREIRKLSEIVRHRHQSHINN